jgi:hypothetical protein
MNNYETALAVIAMRDFYQAQFLYHEAIIEEAWRFSRLSALASGVPDRGIISCVFSIPPSSF